MAICKSCGANVRIGKTCSYCGRKAEAWEYPERNPNIPEVHSIAEFYMAISQIANRYMGQPYNERTVNALESDLNDLIYYTDSCFIPEEIRLHMDDLGLKNIIMEY